MDLNLILNKNLDAGGQKNFQQIGGSHNVQYNADIINYHDGRLTVSRKSQLAIEFCYRVRERSPEVWTFWVHASSAARFDADIRKLACDAGIPGWNDPKSDVFALVYSWLHDKRNGKWIIVLDNVDDAGFLFEKRDENDKNARYRMAYLPPCAHGSTLITSRSRAATARLTDECNIIVVNRMGEAAALALLEKKLGRSPAVEDMQKLADALDYTPLALAQAGAYIKQRGSTYSVGHYLTQIKKSEKSQTRLLTSGSKELRRDEEARDSIILTWQISFDTIRATRPSAADLLSLMSMYNYQGIPEYLLFRTRGTGTKPSAKPPLGPNDAWSDIDESPSASDDEDLEEDEFRDDISTLENFLFISTTFSNVAFEMHPLVQLAARVWLRSHELYQEWARKAIEQLDEALPTGDYENWGRCGELYPHVQSTLGLQLDDREALLRRATIQYKAAWFDTTRGLWSNAKELAASCHNMRRKTLGLEDKETLKAQNVYAEVLRAQGDYEAAEKLHRRALKRREKVRGKEHPDTLASVNNLARVLHAQGDNKAAEKLYRRALQGYEKVLGKEHPNTLTSVSNLAVVLQDQGDYEAVEKLCRQALEGREKVLGKEHPDTLTSVKNFAVVLQDQGDYEAAEKLHRRALEGREKVLGKEHPDTLRSVKNLVGVLQDQGDYEAAEKLHRRALEG
ncbi:hypothetical protein D0865_04290 [Hortaea werneckii]|uniref:Uncharacterized protein n=1 Tax=Hortaea werneckii TaxID=91943 RepID=A0A3M7CT05_HORWE|nr:hypothetical protein D0865_04290 [Hortaea werneckii]